MIQFEIIEVCDDRLTKSNSLTTTLDIDTAKSIFGDDVKFFEPKDRYVCTMYGDAYEINNHSSITIYDKEEKVAIIRFNKFEYKNDIHKIYVSNAKYDITQ